jgi:hypothetical protein
MYLLIGSDILTNRGKLYQLIRGNQHHEQQGEQRGEIDRAGRG